MNTNDLDRRRNTRNNLPGDGLAALVHPKRTSGTTMFAGWGPKLLGLAMALGTSIIPVSKAMALTDPLAPQSCAAPDRDAAVLNNPTPEMSSFAQISGESGDVVIQVHLSSEGTLENATVARSSHFIDLDREALRVANETQFTPAIASCHAVPSTYLYTVSFNAE